jgi:hypothetical protein
MSHATISKPLCGYERRILDAVHERGEMVGQFDLIQRVIGLNSYSWAHTCIHRLERRGLLVIQSGRPGSPNIIRSKAKHE